MLQNPCKSLGFKKKMVYKIPPGGGGKPYPASGLHEVMNQIFDSTDERYTIRHVTGHHSTNVLSVSYTVHTRTAMSVS